MASGKQFYGMPTFADQPVAADPAALTGVALTDSSGGTPSTTIPASTGTYTQSTVNNIAASFAAAINKNTTDIAALRVAVLACTDALQSLGLAASS